MTTNTQRIEALEAQVATLATALEAARTAFADLRAQIKQHSAAKSAPTSKSIPRHEFMAALAEMRDDVEDETALFPVAEIKARVHARRTLAANTEAASVQ